MGKDDIPYLQVLAAKGRIYRYYRRDGRQWGKLDGAPGSHEFAASYIAAEARYAGRHAGRGHAEGSFAAMVVAYKASADYKDLGRRTRQEYDRHLAAMAERFGTYPAAALARKHVLAYRDEFADRHAVGNSRIKVLRKIYSFAVDRGLVAVNPVLRVRKMSEGSYEPWPDAVIARFRESNPLPEIIWTLELAQHTGQRRGDLLTMAWSHYDGEGIEVAQAKTGERLWVPAHPDLKTVLANIPRRSPLILTTATGRAWDAGYFTHAFHKAVVRAGIAGYVFHGLRKTAATRLAEVGCSDAEIMSITGHRTRGMVSHYTRRANQKRLAKAAIARLPVGNRDKNGTGL